MLGLRNDFHASAWLVNYNGYDTSLYQQTT